MTVRTPPESLGEAARLAALRSHHVVDTPPEQVFDDLVHLAATICDTQIALVSLVDEERVWFKARFGLAASHYPWEEAICPEALDSDEPLIVPDTLADHRFAHLACVREAPHVRFYAGVPLVVAGGARLGVLCVVDDRPRHLSDVQLEALRALARQVVWHLERRGDKEQLRVAGQQWQVAEASLLAQEETIRDLEERFRLAFDEAPIGMALVDLRPGAVGQVLEANHALASFLGYSEEQLKDSSFQSVTHPDDLDRNVALTMEVLAGTRDHYELEMRYLHADGSLRWALLHSSALRDASGELICMLSQVVDMTQRHHHEQELVRAANTDALTGLPNRYSLLRTLTETIESDEVTSAALLLIDLDGFKWVNNAAGHLAGDEVLRVVGARFSEVVGPDGPVARVGGDEFAVLCRDMSREAAVELAEALIACLAEPIPVTGQEMYLSASVGVAWTAATDVRAGTVLENADSAMYEAKRRGRARWELFDDRLRAAAALRLRRASGLRAALHTEQLEMHYQPIVDLRDGSIVAAEALLRWNHPEEGVIWPADFISVAEENGSIVAIGRWALRAACLEAAKWGTGGPAVSVNVSARQLSDDDLPATVEEALFASGLPPYRLTLEVTETAVMDDAEHAVRVLRELKTLGVSISLDDFGTGYSSLIYLKRLPVDKLKIDRSFIDDLPDDAEDAAIVTSVVALARAVGLLVVAEGVETAAQWAALRDLGCDFGQGYLWGHPVSGAEAAVRFAATGPDRVLRALAPEPG
jgi:diguanylate cyclase (GGDEF)-like protein/PAS domain S-box-containing protein